MSLARLLVIVSDSAAVMLAGAAIGRRAGTTLVLVGSHMTVRATRAVVLPLLTPPERAAWDEAYPLSGDTDGTWDRPIYSPASTTHPTVPSMTTSAPSLLCAPDAAEAFDLNDLRSVTR